MDKPMIPPDRFKLVEVPPETDPKSRLNPELVTPDMVVHVPAAMVPITGVIQKERVLLGTAMSEVIIAFLKDGVKNTNTRRFFRRHLENANAVFAVADVQDLTRVHVVNFRARLLADGRSKSVHKQALVAARCFLRWVHRATGLPLFREQVLNTLLCLPSKVLSVKLKRKPRPEKGRRLKLVGGFDL